MVKSFATANGPYIFLENGEMVNFGLTLASCMAHGALRGQLLRVATYLVLF